jgi:DNA-directed RNA polymerase specialized sigma24 family protein
MRIWSVERRRQEFTEFYAAAKDDCLRIVLVSVGDRQLAEDLVAEAFTRACVEGMSGDHGMFEDQVIKDGAPLTCHPIDASR